MNRLAEPAQKLNFLWNELLPTSAERVIEQWRTLQMSIPESEQTEGGELRYPDDPVNSFRDEVELILLLLEQEYPPEERRESPVIRESKIGHQIDLLRARMNAYLEYSGINVVIQRLEERLSRIEQVWPPQSFDFRTNLADLNNALLPPNVVQQIKDAVDKFSKGDFENATGVAGKAAEEMTEAFIRFLKLDEILNDPKKKDWGTKLATVYSRINATPMQAEDLRKCVLTLLQTVYWFRNPAMHSSASTSIPSWMDKHIKHKKKSPEHARIAIICALQAALEFQELVEHEPLPDHVANVTAEI